MAVVRNGGGQALRLALAATVTLLLAAAPPVARPPITDWSRIETVVVTARLPGPALWHVQQGSSEVWILATVEPVPADLVWDKRTITKLLVGARLLLLPPRGEVGLFEGAWFVLTGLATLEQPEGTTLEATLPDPLKARFVTARDFADYTIDAFDTLWAEGERHPKMMSIGLHLRMIGRPGRIAALDRIVGHMKQKGAVWFATRRQIAEHWLSTA
jgi:peptidoglycan/xylan/chitin deacetylase (PgdA/CDA1 family)